MLRLRPFPVVALVLVLLPLVAVGPAQGDASRHVIPENGLVAFARDAVWTGTEAYLLGGASLACLGQCLEHQATIERFRPDEGGFATVAFLPSARSSAAAAWDPRPLPDLTCPQGCAYAFGGTHEAGLLDEIVRFDPSLNNATVLPTALPTPRTKMAAAWTGGEVLLLGGEDASGALDDVLAFDPLTGALRTVGSLPRPVRAGEAVYDPRPSAACPSGCAFLLGGRTQEGAPVRDLVQVEPVTGRTWRTAPELPWADEVAAAWLGDRILAVGTQGAAASLVLQGDAEGLPQSLGTTFVGPS